MEEVCLGKLEKRTRRLVGVFVFNLRRQRLGRAKLSREEN